jgi:oligopeptide/dipeptide ABC transporter ATP-binding protein
MSEVVLEVRDLRIYFRAEEGLVKAVDGASYSLHKGKTLGLVGESGSGKTVSALSILRLLDIPPAEIRSGQVLFEGQDLIQLPERKMQSIRGQSISMIFQEPMTSLNPVLSIGFQIGEVLLTHRSMNKIAVREKTIHLLEMVGISPPESRIAEFPHQLSGGMRQRIMIAMALACDPKVLIADEPTTALDVTIQAQILDLMKNLQERLGASVLLITHDLGVVAENAHDVAVMYAGKIVEMGDVKTIFRNPQHPYTEGLLRSLPRVDQSKSTYRLEEIPGTVPNLWDLPPGCSFYDRCPVRKNSCHVDVPELRALTDGHLIRCWKN